MTTTQTDQRTIGDRVIVPGYCRGCDQPTEDVGTIVGFAPQDPSDPFSTDRNVIELRDRAGRLTHVFVGVAQETHLAAYRRAPYCGWCGADQRADNKHDEIECRNVYRRNGRPANHSAPTTTGAGCSRCGAAPGYCDSLAPAACCPGCNHN